MTDRDLAAALRRLHPQLLADLADWLEDRIADDLCEAPTDEADRYRASAGTLLAAVDAAQRGGFA